MLINKKNNRGISLIALVVTIIVLIILTGISTNVLRGDNGLIKKAREERIEVNEVVENTLKGLDTIYNERQKIQ